MNLDEIRCVARVYSLFVKDVTAYKHVSKKYIENPAYQHIKTLGSVVLNAKKEITELAEELVGDTLVYKWCKNVKGLGVVAALTYIGYIDPHRPIRCNYKYWGFAPGCKKVAGERARCNFWLKGRGMYFAECIIYKKDPFYYPLYKLKKEIYSMREDLKGASEGKIDGKARFWLAKLLISHAHALMRKELGIPIGEHHPHIPPKPFDGELVGPMLNKAIEELRKAHGL